MVVFILASESLRRSCPTSPRPATGGSGGGGGGGGGTGIQTITYKPQVNPLPPGPCSAHVAATIHCQPVSATTPLPMPTQY
ncbi:hypothetical protein E2C01_099051 [Portunus trituberculatus]|uniref:Uncharacterized protein n=1 Tax=Portunus trituberculatus TaxID=210409 RepID=A0A5B7K4G5_PORTR|nr:hypothetical protein [Portunus trituberculatus]